MITYSVTKANLIDDCSDDWDDQAIKNGGLLATTSVVKGRSVLSFVSGLATRSYLNALFFACRQTHQPLDVAYRCNWQGGSQVFRMEIRSLGDGALEVAHRPMSEMNVGPKSVLVLDDHRQTSQCSQCLRVLIRQVWIDVFHRLADEDFVLHDAVCPSCRSAAIAEIKRFPGSQG